MINFDMGSFWTGLEFLTQELRLTSYAAENKDGQVDEAQHSRIQTNVNFTIRECAAKLLLMDANTACLKLENLFNRYQYAKYTYGEFSCRVTASLRGYQNRSYSRIFLNHYPREMAKLVFSVGS
jgi:hypothetical protein